MAVLSQQFVSSTALALRESKTDTTLINRSNFEFLSKNKYFNSLLTKNILRNPVTCSLSSNFFSPFFNRNSTSYSIKKTPSIRVRSIASNNQSETVEVAESISEKTEKSEIGHFYRKPLLSVSATKSLLHLVQEKISEDIIDIETEQCFNIQYNDDLSEEHEKALLWLLSETYEPTFLQRNSHFDSYSPSLGHVIEVGPRLSFSTAWATNVTSICNACGIQEVSRIERSRRFYLRLSSNSSPLTEEQLADFASIVHDRMTECVYTSPLSSFKSDVIPSPVYRIPVLEEGRKALEDLDKKMGLAFDDFDFQYYTDLFLNDIKRNPTNVEMFDIAQSNSEHSRHWFFKGELTIDGEKVPHSLFDLVKATLRANPNNSVIGFHDNSSAIRGKEVTPILPTDPGRPSPLKAMDRDFDILFTAETHNFPCAVAPFPGAETGAGGRIRDTHATGIGSLIVAATAGYCVGNLQLEGHFAPWEDSSFEYPSNLASPLKILIDASDGASDYGNKFGEPLIQGFTRSFGMRLLNGERREWLKPIMFSGGIGQIDHNHLEKSDPEIGMLVVKIGGPAYRIGMGGGAASSMVSGTRDAELDFNAVQRGDAEMSQKLYRVVRTCVELGSENPIVSIHDQGAGGNCNVVKEIIYPKGAKIDVRKIILGDETLSILEIWGAEYQEQDAILIKPESEFLLKSICDRERLSMAVIGQISGDGKVILVDSLEEEKCKSQNLPPPLPAVDLDLEKVLGDMPNKKYNFVRNTYELEALDISPSVTVEEALKRVFRLPSVASKRFLTTKVDRCVSGLVAQQQTVGPLQLTLADVAVIAQTHTGISGAACSIGEQPIKGLLNPSAMARMAIGEALTNLVWAKVTALGDVKASGNWMYAAKMGGEGSAMYDAAMALRDAMIQLEIAIDGGKDSLSMAARAGEETVMAPGNLVMSTYVTCPDITLTITPDLKLGEDGIFLHVDIANGFRRLGGSAFAHSFDQLGNECPDADMNILKNAFNTVQELMGKKLIASGHDISDGGIITSIFEMSFAGNTGFDVHLPLPPQMHNSPLPLFSSLFSEELGLILEVSEANKDEVLTAFEKSNVPCTMIGRGRKDKNFNLFVNEEMILSSNNNRNITNNDNNKDDITYWRDVWENTSFLLEEKQRTENCVSAERENLKHRVVPSWKLSFTPSSTPKEILERTDKFRVAVIREEGSNGDREMAAMVSAAGFEPWDVTMSDLLHERTSLQNFRGIVFVGGFSYADVLDSAKGWASTIRFNSSLLLQFQAFYDREDTFSLGVCNGCQLMALLGWVPGKEVGGTLSSGGDIEQPRFVHNESGRFECRFSSVTIQNSPAIMLKGMEGTTVGVWAAHGEGKALFPKKEIFDQVISDKLAPIRYCDDSANVTEQYPFNPNGSPDGIAALCSPDGRHLAMMPHPERCFLMWQFPWYPQEWKHLDASGPSPWLKLFQNAREWCESD